MVFQPRIHISTRIYISTSYSSHRFLYLRDGGTIGPSASRIASLQHVSQAKYYYVEAARSLLAERRIHEARDALYMYWDFQDDGKGEELKKYAFALKSYGHVLRLFIVAAYVDLAKEEGVEGQLWSRVGKSCLLCPLSC